MFSKQARDKKRYLYFMDDINESKVDYESLIKLPVSLDLSIAVLKDGEWGSYRNLAIDSSKLTTVSKKKRHPKNLQLESVHMHFFCFDSISREITNFKDHSYGIEYSGVDESGKRIMGLTCINSADHVNKRDPILLWRIPQEWSLEDAVTVPFIYAQAYYVVMLTTGMGFASSVLINVGKEILFSEVCIAIFLNKKFCVYVTVSNGVQATRIKKRFPGLKDFHILSENKCEYEHQLLRLTNGNGVDIVVNCLSGTHHVTASLNCAGKMSYYAEIGKNNCSDLCSLGLYPFLKSVSFIVIPNKITSILKLPTEEKQLLQKQLEDGINSGLLTPLSKTTVNNEPIKNNLMKVTNEHAPKMGNYDKMNQTLKYGINYSYIIIGDEGTRSSWVELVEWLMNKGVSRFFIALNYFPGKVDISRRLNRILNRKKTSILFTSSQSINTVQGAVNLITRANEVAPLEAIFFVSVNCAGTKILNMDTALKLNNSKVHFISLFSGGLNELESRRRRGLSSMILYSNRLPKNLTNIFSEIDALLEKNVSTDENNSILYEVIDDTVLKESRNRMLGLNDYFPKNLKTLAEIGYDITKTAIFKERTSLSAPYSKTRGVYPIFIIPSVHGMELDSLLRKLYYPVFCATLSESSFSITTVAFELFENLKSIQSDGPVTLIGETWSAAIAIELSSLIKLEKRNVKLFLLEGDPIKWKLQIMNFGIIDPDQIENYLIKQYFDSDSKFNSNSTLLPIHSFKTHLKNYVSKLTPNNSNFKYVIKAANILQKRLLTASKYELKDEILKHVTLFTQSFSENFSHKLSESSEVIVVQEDSYENFIQNTHIVTTINNEANFAWWSNTD